jgi:AraC-like DNA-binding protein
MMSAAELELRAGPAHDRLAEFVRVATDDVDEAADAIGRIFCPHELAPITTSGFSARHNSAAFDGFSINCVSYGGSVTIDPGCLDRFFLVQIPLSGTADVRTGGAAIQTAPGRMASLLSPTMPTRMTWSDCAQMILLLDRRLVEQRAAALSGRASGAVEFAPALDLATPGGRELSTRLAALMALAERLGPAGRLSPLAAGDWRETLLDLLLHGQKHQLSEAIRTFSGRAERLPRALRTARDWIDANACMPLDLAELAGVSGLGIRALQLGFRRHFGMSISEMLLDLRLAELHARLLRAEPDASITEIAFDLGFTHLGRMAGAYRGKFGETPSATLRRRLS